MTAAAAAAARRASLSIRDLKAEAKRLGVKDKEVQSVLERDELVDLVAEAAARQEPGGNKKARFGLDRGTAASAEGSPAPSPAEVAKERGNAAFKARDFVKAAHQYSMAIRLDPGNHVLFSNRSAAYASQGSWDKAHADACRCVKLRPGWGKGYARKGAALVGKGQAGEALKVYKQGLAAEPGNAACKDGIADAKEAIRRNRRAYEEFTGEKHPGAAA